MLNAKISQDAAAMLTSVSKDDRRKLGQTIRKLQEDPRMMGSQKLQAAGGYYRFREGDYRIIYKFDDDTIYVDHVKKRDEGTYKL